MAIVWGIAIVGIVVLLVLSFVVQSRPDTFRVERSAHLAAPPEVVFPLVNNLPAWQKWSPWEGRDPAMKRIYEGPEAGPGATYKWIGNRHVGEGRMTITDSKPSEFIDIELEFIKPFAGTNRTLFTFTPEQDGTRATWTMDGKNTLPGKLISLFLNMDKMIGNDFEAGLANLGTAANAPVVEK